ncbi:pyridoxamine 5'-phosphate oxidase family protein [Amycolatopsis minnesotensis]|uniref:Pyridoxamine 5'-phosphate oxidase family protein n=1 Tax=Amycolatopsis minnesotensis TaxID=337894 RepID=A0ABN2SR44_9PSEU
MSRKMTVEEREVFLSEVHVGVVSVARENGRAPLAVPVWYAYTPGGELVLNTGKDSLKRRLIEAAGRISLSVQIETPPYRYVTVEGPVTGITTATAEELRSVAYRYLDAPSADGFLAGIDPASEVTVHMRPEHWISSDFRE